MLNDHCHRVSIQLQSINIILYYNLCNFCLSVLPPCLSNSGVILSETDCLFQLQFIDYKVYFVILYDDSRICDGLFVSSLTMFCISVASAVLNISQK
jgi:hypothetical protein